MTWAGLAAIVLKRDSTCSAKMIDARTKCREVRSLSSLEEAGELAPNATHCTSSVTIRGHVEVVSTKGGRLCVEAVQKSYPVFIVEK